jgi:YVTN family beta-propeller protein
MALAIDAPTREAARFALSTNYLQEANEGIYELAYDNGSHHLFAAVTDRMNRAANKGFLYAFNPQTLAVESRLEMPYRAFSLALNPMQHQLYVGHTQSASLRISLVDSKTGKLLKTSDKLSFNHANAADARFEHLRHMVYSPAANTLFVSYSNMLKNGEGMQPVHKLLMLDGTTLALKGEVKDAYSGTAYGLTMDEKTQKIYVGGKDYINEIDARTQTRLRTIALKDVKPQISSLQNLAVDSDSHRVFAVVFNHDDRSGPNDGLYIFDLRDGKQLGYVHTGAGTNAVKYNPKYNELYVTNFTSGTISVVDATTYKVTREFAVPVYPNQMALSDDLDTLYIGIKEGFNRDWDPDVFVKGAKERILSIDLKKS